MSQNFDNGMMKMIAQYSSAIADREARVAAAEKADRDFTALALIAEGLAREMDGFDAHREPALSPVNAHTGAAHFFINGFAGMPVKFINPRKSGLAAVAAFNAGVAKRRELKA